MGMYHSAYFAYGIRVPDVDPERLEDADYPEGVGYLMAGSYDRDMTFLTTKCDSADLGKFAQVKPEEFPAEQRASWDEALRTAATRLGVEPQTEPGWFLVPDMS